MLIPSARVDGTIHTPSLSRRVNANSQLDPGASMVFDKLIKKGEC